MTTPDPANEPALTGGLETADGHPALRFERHLNHPITEREKAARDAAGWEACFARFDALLAGTPMSETDSLEIWPEMHERYAQRFGVDPEIGRAAFAQHHTQRSG
jgi:hypothetical protein